MKNSIWGSIPKIALSTAVSAVVMSGLSPSVSSLLVASTAEPGQVIDELSGGDGLPWRLNRVGTIGGACHFGRGQQVAVVFPESGDVHLILSRLNIGVFLSGLGQAGSVAPIWPESDSSSGISYSPFAIAWRNVDQAVGLFARPATKPELSYAGAVGGELLRPCHLLLRGLNNGSRPIEILRY